MCLVAWPLNESEAGVSIPRFEINPPCFSSANDTVLMLISRNLQKKRREVYVKIRLTPTSLSFKDQATMHTTVKWSIQMKHSIDQAMLLWMNGKKPLKQHIEPRTSSMCVCHGNWPGIDSEDTDLLLCFFRKSILNLQTRKQQHQ